MVKPRINVELYGNSRRDRTISGADSIGSNFHSGEHLFDENGDAAFSKETNVEDVTGSLPSHITQTRYTIVVFVLKYDLPWTDWSLLCRGRRRGTYTMINIQVAITMDLNTHYND